MSWRSSGRFPEERWAGFEQDSLSGKREKHKADSIGGKEDDLGGTGEHCSLF